MEIQEIRFRFYSPGGAAPFPAGTAELFFFQPPPPPSWDGLDREFFKLLRPVFSFPDSDVCKNKEADR